MRAEPGERRGPGGPRPAPSSTSRTSTLIPSTRRTPSPGARLPQHRWPCRCSATAQPIGAITVARARGPAVLRPADRAAPDLRRPGRHRHRERPAVPGAGAAQPRPHRDPRAADGHRRDPARHLQLPDRRPARLRHHRSRAPRGSARRRIGVVFRFDGRAAPLRRPPRARSPEASRPSREPSRCRRDRDRRGPISSRPGVGAHPGRPRGSRAPQSRRCRSGVRPTGASWPCPCCATATPIGAITVGALGGAAVLRASRSRSSRPSPTRPSSPSRTSACSRSSRRGTATSPRPSSSRPPPARSCASSRARRPTSSRSSTRSPRARCRLCGATWSVGHAVRRRAAPPGLAPQRGATPRGMEALRRAFPRRAARRRTRRTGRS